MKRILKWALPSILKMLHSKVAKVVFEDWKDRDRMLTHSYTQAIVHVAEVALLAFMKPKQAVGMLKSYAILKAGYTIAICNNGRNMQYWLVREGKQSEEFQRLAKLQTELHYAQELALFAIMAQDGKEAPNDEQPNQ